MKILFSAIGLMCLLFLTVQCQPKSTDITTSKTSLSEGKYVQGKIVIPANSKYKTGVIRAYIDEDQDPKRLRGLVYQRSGSTSFSLHDEVYFQVEQSNGIVMATNVTKADKSAEMYAGNIAYDMNLHVSHVEDGVHTKVHIIRPTGGGNFVAGPTIDGISLTKINIYNVPASGSPDPTQSRPIYVKSSTLSSLDLDLDYYMSQITILDGNKVYDLSLTHDHLYD